MTEAPVCVGIDISNARLDVAMRPLGIACSVDHDEAGIVTLIERLRRHPPAVVVLEATGGLEVVVASALAAAELPVVVVHPRRRGISPTPPAAWPRRMPLMRRCWPSSPTRCGRPAGRGLTPAPRPWRP